MGKREKTVNAGDMKTREGTGRNGEGGTGGPRQELGGRWEGKQGQ